MKRQVFTLSLLGLAMLANAQKTVREAIRGDKGITNHDVRLPEAALHHRLLLATALATLTPAAIP